MVAMPTTRMVSTSHHSLKALSLGSSREWGGKQTAHFNDWGGGEEPQVVGVQLMDQPVLHPLSVLLQHHHPFIVCFQQILFKAFYAQICF